MTGARIEITLDDSALRPALARIERAAGDLRRAFDEIGGVLVTSVLDRFESGQGPDGEAWAPSERARSQGGKTLVDRGHLRDSITHRAGASGVEVGTNLVYGAIHQFGGVIEPKNGRTLTFKVGDGFRTVSRVDMPARPYLGLSGGDRREIVAILEDHLAEALDGGAR